MHPWIRVGRRLEYTVGALTIAEFLIFGFIVAERAPSNTRWFAWLVWAGFIFPFNFVALLVGRWARRRAIESSTGGTAKNRQIKIRLFVYGVTALLIRGQR